MSAKHPQCSITRVAELLSDTWTILIIHHMITQKTLRFCELERLLEGISTRTLTRKLESLEEKNIISNKNCIIFYVGKSTH